MGEEVNGEVEFAKAFEFRKGIPTQDHLKLRDFLYKFSINLGKAKEYLTLLKQIDEIDYDKTSFIYLINDTAFQSFTLAMRRMTDASSKRSMQKFVNQVFRKELKDKFIEELGDIHGHYRLYVDKSIAHQDEQSILESLKSFPDTDIIDLDIKYLTSLFRLITKELCTSYVEYGINEEPDYKHELSLLNDNK